MKIDIYTKLGEKKGTATLNKDLFERVVNKDLMHRMIVLQQANARYPLAHTLEKGEVRGGGAKPFAQKGSGRARQGSIRNPHYKGGGVAFGPRKNKNFTTALPKKMRRQALLSALSVRAADQAYFGLEDYGTETKTANFVKLMAKLPVERSMLLVVSGDNVALERSAHNVPNVKVLQAAYLNLIDVLRFEKICFVGEAQSVVESTFAINK